MFWPQDMVSLTHFIEQRWIEILGTFRSGISQSISSGCGAAVFFADEMRGQLRLAS